MRVARKLVAVMLVSFLGVFAVLAYFDSKRIASGIRERATTELRAAGRTLAPMLAEIGGNEGPARARELVVVTNAAAQRVGVRARWVALDDPNAPISPQQRATLRAGHAVVDTSNDDLIDVYTPIDSDDAAIELTQHVRDAGPVPGSIVGRWIFVAGVAISIATAISSAAAIVLLGAPLRKLADHARAIGTGDLDRRISLRRNDELGLLAAEMNTMSDRLAEARRRAARDAEAKASAEAQVRHADKMSTVGTLAAGMAHELGTPLNVVGGRATMIASAPEATPHAVRDAEIISNQVARMTRIIRGLLDFARRTPTTKANADLEALARRVLDLLGPLAAKREITLALDPDSEALDAEVDAGQVEQALANIVLNAIHATQGPGEVTVSLSRVHAAAPTETVPRDWACIVVTDRGAGIPPDSLPHVFEPFFTTKEVGEGTGLGLSVTYGILHEHGGFVDVQSTVGAGTRVSLYFPV
jgi:two-component system NtrC family sensor kinase